MAVKIYRHADLDPSPLQGKNIAVLGYGNQGQAHALNLRDSGLQVIVGARPDGVGFQRAHSVGFDPVPIPQAVGRGDLIIMALPDDLAPGIYQRQVLAHLTGGKALGFIHGFNIHYQRIRVPQTVDVLMVAPKGAGYMVRQAYTAGHGVAALVAVHQDATGEALGRALAWARGIGAARAGVIESTFAAETETDLFGEQAAVVGGVVALMQAAFDTLVAAGYEPEHAYLECVHEVKFVVDLIHTQGIRGMRGQISSTAAYGGFTRAPRLQQALRPLMEEILDDIRCGRFASEWCPTGAAPGSRPQVPDDEHHDLLERTRQQLGTVLGGVDQVADRSDPPIT